MSIQNRRSSFMSSTRSSNAKRQVVSSSFDENVRKLNALDSNSVKKRAALGNITNQKTAGRTSVSATLVPSKFSRAKKTSPIRNAGRLSNVLPMVQARKSIPCKITSIPKTNEAAPSMYPMLSVPRNIHDVSPSKSDGDSVSMDDSMSSCDSFNSPDVEYIDHNDVSAIVSIERKTLSNLFISDKLETPGDICSKDVLTEVEEDDKFVDIDNDYTEPQLCATYACDIYKHLRASEVKKRPSTNFMETIQKDLNISMRAILVDWLVEVAEEYRLLPETLYLSVNYIDRYLSGNLMGRQKLQLLGVACMMIASKYEEICAPQVEEFCYITDNTYSKEEVLEMESSVLNYLKFEMTATTPKCFLRRFVRAAQATWEVPSMHLECLASYITELSLVEYTMLKYAPSLIAASAVFLATYILTPSKRPWNSTLRHYTQYQPSDLSVCVKDLHRLCCESHTSNLPAINEKYSQHKYKCVAKKFCPPSIPRDFFVNQS